MANHKKEVDAKTRKAWQRLIRNGKTRVDIANKYGVTRQFVSSVVGPMPRVEGRKEKTVYVPKKEWDAVVKICESLGLRILTGPTAGKGSVAMLIEKIGRGELIVTSQRDIAS